jgi:hypothetical protein
MPVAVLQQFPALVLAYSCYVSPFFVRLIKKLVGGGGSFRLEHPRYFSSGIFQCQLACNAPCITRRNVR